MTSLSSPITLTSVLYSLVICVSLSVGVAFIFFHIDKGMMFEEAPESTKQLWIFILYISNVNKNGGIDDQGFLLENTIFTLGLLSSV